MNLIYYRGLNCHLACVVNIADSLGINYRDAFGTLWSETDFFDDPKHRLYLSRRVIPNLEALGIRVEVLGCVPGEETQESFSLIPEGELFIAGMDTFHTPWNLAYQKGHEAHYFFARKEKRDAVSCFDPMYDQKNLQFNSGDIVPYVFELSRIHKLPVTPPRFEAGQEAREILRKHPETRENLQLEIDRCRNNQGENRNPLMKQITAMVNNRYLFQRFLHQYPFALDHDPPFFDEAFLAKWEAVKHGVYKASIMRNNGSTVDEVRELFLDLMQEEIEMAWEMVLTESDFGCEVSSVPSALT